MEVKIEEFWIAVSAYPRFLISNTGKVYDKETAEILPQKVKAKYYWVILPGLYWTKRHWLTHRLILFAFTGVLTSRKLQCNHIDGNKLNNHISNLELVTPSDNLIHAYQNGLHPRAWANYRIKFGGLWSEKQKANKKPRTNKYDHLRE